ncbi:hypothetical protein Tco_1199060 [Tanacetum coccineum]
MVRRKSVSKQQSQQVNPDDEGGDDLNIADDVTQASKKRKKTTKAPIEQSIAEKEKADIRKRLHLLKDDIYTMVIMFFSSFAQIMEGDSSWILLSGNQGRLLSR